MLAILNLIGGAFLITTAIYLIKVPRPPQTKRETLILKNMRKAGFFALAAAGTQIALAALRTWGPP